MTSCKKLCGCRWTTVPNDDDASEFVVWVLLVVVGGFFSIVSQQQLLGDIECGFLGVIDFCVD